MQVINGDRGLEEGELPAGAASNVVFSPDGSRIYLAETLWTHNNRDKRQDILTVYDTRTLSVTNEISLPGRTLVAWKIKSLELNLVAKPGDSRAARPISCSLRIVGLLREDIVSGRIVQVIPHLFF